MAEINDMNPNNAGLLSALARMPLLGPLGQQTNQPPTTEAIEDWRKTGRQMIEQPVPPEMRHWGQVVAAILQRIGGQQALNRSYQMAGQGPTIPSSSGAAPAPAAPAAPAVQPPASPSATNWIDFFSGAGPRRPNNTDLPFNPYGP